ncbi:ABC transporter ATP-binding protein [Thalassotalea sp. HSM 43]|uniref:ABC transporter ATP-binding protein n=1 Tax=Thalassotalea sp. HSM 43 TaxID=2552945 RepID=UPI0010804C50|nr:ABC transporter ATP-binding protein [Thalassotalea sp. HSM 43]QBY03527.1 ABC transporter ATP-binding protein [Thalassotalea sp. HSM 43]
MFKLFESWVAALPENKVSQPPGKLWKFCRHYTKGFELPLVFMSILTAALAILEVSLFGVMGQLVDMLSSNSPDTLWQNEGGKLLTYGLIVVVVIPILVLLHALIIYQGLLGNYPMSIRWSAHRYMLRQSVSFYQDDFAGRVATKVMQTALAVRETVTKLLDVLVYITIYVVTMAVMMADADLRLLWPMLIWMVAYALLQVYFLPRLKRVSTEQADARSLMTGRIVDSYTNIQTVKLFAHTDQEAAYAKQSMEGFLDTVYRQMRMVTGINFSVQLINYLLIFSVAAIAIYLWTIEAISVGAIAVAIALVLRLSSMSQWIMWEVSGLFENIGTVADGMNTLSKPTAVQDTANAGDLNVSQGAISFSNVSFHYGENIGVIDGLDLQIKPGEKVGLVGRSGAGKSTMVNLLMRFYDLEKGRISIDEQDISQIKQDSLRAHIGMVTQDTSLLHRSIRENILYGKPSASEDELLAAIEQAEASEFIATLTDPHGNKGLDAQVGERGVKLSGGQRQRIAIARVLLKNAPILLLDEATSALDSEVEAAIQASLYQLMEGKTVIAIAHRLSTIAAMDRLIVLDQGKIVEQGNHQQLVAKKGIYAQLWAHQTGGFLGLE